MPVGEDAPPSSRPRFTPRSRTEAVGSRNGIDVVSLAMTCPDPDDPDPADPDPVAAPDPDDPDPADPDPVTGSVEADAADCADAAGCTPSGNDGGGAEVFCSLQ